MAALEPSTAPVGSRTPPSPSRNRNSQSGDDHGNEVFKIVLTGGPCAGKTTALARLSAFLNERGFRVFTVPEAATMLFTNGVRFQDLDAPGAPVVFQHSLMRMQMELEDSFARIAAGTGYASVILCDRGACDGKAYVDQEKWDQILALQHLESEVPIREGRYNAVFHLVTAANGAEKFYTLANNEARSESPEMAREVDIKSQQAWIGHPRHYVFDNSTDFEGKMQRVVDSMAKIVGLPLVQRTPTKFVLRPFTDLSLDEQPAGTPRGDPLETWLETALGEEPLMVFDVEKIYVLLNSGGTEGGPPTNKLVKRLSGMGEGKSDIDLTALGEAEASVAGGGIEDETTLEYSFIRRRTHGANSGYGHTLVKKGANGERIEMKRIISRREYDWMKRMYADPSRHIVLQRRYTFLWEQKAFSIHRYIQPKDDLCILHCQAAQNAEGSDAFAEAAAVGASIDGTDGEAGGEAMRFPPFLDVGDPLDDDGKLSAYSISVRTATP